MTAVTMEPQRTQPDSLRRIVHAARLHVANPWGTLILPWLIYGGIFALTWIIWRMVANAAGNGLEENAFTYNGGGFWVLFYMLVVAVQAMNLTFRFALGLSLTRREYYLGTAGYFVALAIMYSTGVTLAAVIERATDGWGVNGAFFVPFYAQDASFGEIWMTWFGLFLLFFFLGAAVATVYVRWGSNGLIVFFAALALFLIAIIWSIVNFGMATDVGRWLAGLSLAEWTALAVVVSAINGVIGYALLRRATPRS